MSLNVTTVCDLSRSFATGSIGFLFRASLADRFLRFSLAGGALTLIVEVGDELNELGPELTGEVGDDVSFSLPAEINGLKVEDNVRVNFPIRDFLLGFVFSSVSLLLLLVLLSEVGLSIRLASESAAVNPFEVGS